MAAQGGRRSVGDGSRLTQEAVIGMLPKHQREQTGILRGEMTKGSALPRPRVPGMLDEYRDLDAYVLAGSACIRASAELRLGPAVARISSRRLSDRPF